MDMGYAELAVKGYPLVEQAFQLTIVVVEIGGIIRQHGAGYVIHICHCLGIMVFQGTRVYLKKIVYILYSSSRKIHINTISAARKYTIPA